MKTLKEFRIFSLLLLAVSLTILVSAPSSWAQSSCAGSFQGSKTLPLLSSLYRGEPYPPRGSRFSPFPHGSSSSLRDEATEKLHPRSMDGVFGLRTTRAVIRPAKVKTVVIEGETVQVEVQPAVYRYSAQLTGIDGTVLHKSSYTYKGDNHNLKHNPFAKGFFSSATVIVAPSLLDRNGWEVGFRIFEVIDGKLVNRTEIFSFGHNDFFGLRPKSRLVPIGFSPDFLTVAFIEIEHVTLHESVRRVLTYDTITQQQTAYDLQKGLGTERILLEGGVHFQNNTILSFPRGLNGIASYILDLDNGVLSTVAESRYSRGPIPVQHLGVKPYKP